LITCNSIIKLKFFTDISLVDEAKIRVGRLPAYHIDESIPFSVVNDKQKTVLQQATITSIKEAPLSH